MRTTWITILNPPPPFTDLCTSLHTPTPKLLFVSSVLIRGSVKGLDLPLRH